MKRVVVTGAAGYIGGQTCIELKQHGYHVSGVDRRSIPEHLTKFLDLAIQCDIVDAAARCSMSDAVVHCAGTSLVGPSIADPAEYYSNNVGATARLLKELNYYDWHGRFVFSSSAAVYGKPNRLPLDEIADTNPINPYGRSKLFCEELIHDSARAYNFSAVCLRYFNACGADVLGRHGQESAATHIFAQLFEAAKNNTEFQLYGDQYNTPDGTCIRDYVHVIDIARAHRFAIEKSAPIGRNIFNIGTSKGLSVKEIIRAVETQLQKNIRIKLCDPRAGDPTELVANGQRFNSFFGYEPEYSDLPTIIHSLKKWYKI